jgi:hypothetical protein
MANKKQSMSNDPEYGNIVVPMETLPVAQSPTNNAVNRSGEVGRI